MHDSSMKIMSQLRGYMKHIETVLDVGSQDVNGTYKLLFDGIHYLGLDISPGANVDCPVANPYDWSELHGMQFDAVISGQCLEHCERPWLTAQQILRHCKPGGWIAVIAPFVQRKHGYPHDYYRYTEDGLAALFCGGINIIAGGIDKGTGSITDAWLLAQKKRTH